MNFLLDKVVVIGVGLIGGSFALALKQAGVVRHVVGVGRTLAPLARALELGIIDSIADSIHVAVKDAQIVFIATPVAQTTAILSTITPYLEPHTVLTDAGSTKLDVVNAARTTLGTKIGQFVPAHPIAGRELNGPDAALPGLYIGKKVVLTPLAENTLASMETVSNAWQACGAVVHQMPPAQHDRIFAAVSHLPHLLAYALVDQIEAAPDAAQLFQFAASGFRDFTRIAGSSPEMWRDIALANKKALLAEMNSYSTQLDNLKVMLATDDGEGLYKMFANAQRARHAWLASSEANELPLTTGGE